MDDAEKIASIANRFKEERRLISVETITHDGYSAMCNLRYVMDPTSSSNPYEYMKYLVNKCASVTIKMEIKC